MHADDLVLVSVDDHICEPADMFDAHVPTAYRDQAPRVEEEPDGSQQWYYGSIRGRNLGLNAVAGKPPEMFNVNPTRYEDMRPGCYDVDERVRDMSAGGQLAGLNFPNWTGFSGQVLNEGPDRAVNLVMIKAYNDWHVDEWCAAHPERFIPCGILPLFDVDEAATEVRRLADKGCHAVTFSENPAGLGMPSIHTDHWDRLFAACCDAGTVLCCHVGSSSKAASTSPDAPPPVPMSISSSMSIYTLGDLLWADFWHRFPALRFSLTEGDIGWIPYFLWRAEHTLDRHNGWMHHELAQGLRPTELFRERIICCFINDRIGIKLLDEFNIENVCWESDYPHSDSSWPDAPERAAELLAELPDDTVAAVTHGNAMRHFRFDPFSIRPPEQCTAAALRAEATDVDTVTHVGRPADERDIATWKHMTGAAARRSMSRFFPYELDPRFALLLRGTGLRPARHGVTLTDDGRFVATFSFFKVDTPLANVAGAHVTRDYRWWTSVGVRASAADDGLTFGTNNHAGVCVHFHDKVKRVVGFRDHSAVTVTVADVDGLVAALTAHSKTSGTS